MFNNKNTFQRETLNSKEKNHIRNTVTSYTLKWSCPGVICSFDYEYTYAPPTKK